MTTPPIIDPRTTPAPAMFGRVLRKDDPEGLRLALLDYRMITSPLAEKPKLHMMTGPSGSLTLGVQIVARKVPRSNAREAALVEEFIDYLREQGLPYERLEDLLARPGTDVNDQQRLWLTGYRDRWETYFATQDGIQAELDTEDWIEEELADLNNDGGRC